MKRRSFKKKETNIFSIPFLPYYLKPLNLIKCFNTYHSTLHARIPRIFLLIAYHQVADYTYTPRHLFSARPRALPSLLASSPSSISNLLELATSAKRLEKANVEGCGGSWKSPFLEFTFHHPPSALSLLPFFLPHLFRGPPSPSLRCSFLGACTCAYRPRHIAL